MTLIELIKISREILKLLSESDINTGDVRFVDLYADYEKMLERGYKVTYIVEVLSARYSVSPSKVYRILRKFKKPVRI